MIQMAPFGRKLKRILGISIEAVVVVGFGERRSSFVVMALYIVFEVISQLAVVAT